MKKQIKKLLIGYCRNETVFYNKDDEKAQSDCAKNQTEDLIIPNWWVAIDYK